MWVNHWCWINQFSYTQISIGRCQFLLLADPLGKFRGVQHLQFSVPMKCWWKHESRPNTQGCFVSVKSYNHGFGHQRLWHRWTLESSSTAVECNVVCRFGTTKTYTQTIPGLRCCKPPLDSGNFPQEKIRRKKLSWLTVTHSETFFCSLEWMIHLGKLVGITPLGVTFCRSGFWKWNQEPRVRISEWRLDLVGWNPVTLSVIYFLLLKLGDWRLEILWSIWGLLHSTVLWNQKHQYIRYADMPMQKRNDYANVSHWCISFVHSTQIRSQRMGRALKRARFHLDVQQEFVPTWWPSMPPSVQALDAGGWHCTSWHVPMWPRCQQVPLCCWREGVAATGKLLLNKLTLHCHCVPLVVMEYISCMSRQEIWCFLMLSLPNFSCIEDLRDVG